MVDTILTDTIEHIITEVQASGQVLRADAPGTVWFRQTIATQVNTFLTNDAIHRLEGIPVFLCERPIYNALAKLTRYGEPYIIIYEGFMQACTYRVSMCMLLDGVRRSLRNHPGNECITYAEVDSHFHNAVFLIYWFYLSSETIDFPGLYDVLSVRHREQSYVALAGILAFVYMHEVGHIRLGHLTAEEPSVPQIYSSLEYESSSHRKEKEFQADAFAISSFRRELMPGMAGNVLMFFKIASDLECMCIPQSGSHPLMINRLQKLISVAGLATDASYGDVAKDSQQRRRSLTTDCLKALSLYAQYSSALNTRTAVAHFKSLLPSKEECVRCFEKLKSIYGRFAEA